jgi:plasmid maintenance system killer protein
MKAGAPWPVGKRAGEGVDQHEMCSLRARSRRFFKLAQDSSLGGIRRPHYAVSVSGNWRVTFRIEDGHAVDVDYADYH